MQETISKLIEQINSIWKTYEDSWNDEKYCYTIPEPKEIDKLGNQIKKALVKHSDELPVDFILESLTSLGDAPQLLYDDNGHFAISGDGYAPAPMSDSGKFEEDVSLTAIVEPDMWYDTIRGALNHYLKS